MYSVNHPKFWFIIALLAFLSTFMLIIIKHYNADNDRRQKIYRRAEIKDTV